MKALIEALMKNKDKRFYKLQRVTPLSEIQDPNIKDLLERLSREDAGHQILGLVINAAFTERKSSFIFSGGLLQELIDSHPGYLSSQYNVKSQNSRLYKAVTKLLDNNGKDGPKRIARIVKKTKTNVPKPAVLEIVNPDLLIAVGGRDEELLLECIQFVKKTKATQRKGKGKEASGNRKDEIRNEKLENQEIEIRKEKLEISNRKLESVDDTANDTPRDAVIRKPSFKDRASSPGSGLRRELAKFNTESNYELSSFRAYLGNFSSRPLPDEEFRSLVEQTGISEGMTKLLIANYTLHWKVT